MTTLARPRTLLAMAAVAVAFAAADTYVVVLALPEMMAAVGVPIDQLQKAAPIVSGFLLGYVAMLPLIGRIADLRGRVPVLVAALVVFAAGSLVTALAYDMPTMVLGRFLQGVGGGGLVPATLALVADLYPVERRGVPLGVVSAVQEIGSVLGPLFGAVVLSVADWRLIFVINLVVGLVLAVAIRRLAGATDPRPGALRLAGLGAAPGHLAGGGAGLPPPSPAAARPDLGRDVRAVRRRLPLADPGRRRGHRRRRPVPGPHPDRQPAARRPAQLGGHRPRGRPHRRPAARGGALGRDPGLRDRRPTDRGVLRPRALVPPRRRGRGRRVRSAPAPHRGTRSSRPAPCAALPPGAPWRSASSSGAALIAALIDIPIFARTTIYPDSQLMAALVLVRFLVALPVGAVARRLPHPPAARRCRHRGRHGVRGGGLRLDEHLAPGDASSTPRRRSRW